MPQLTYPVQRQLLLPLLRAWSDSQLSFTEIYWKTSGRLLVVRSRLKGVRRYAAGDQAAYRVLMRAAALRWRASGSVAQLRLAREFSWAWWTSGGCFR